jgi:TM2 domain-containing membrane protein YozV
MKDKIVAGVLALILGTLGIHWFYLNQTSKGVTYLVVTIIGWIFSIIIIGLIPVFIIGVLSLIDGIKLLTMDDNTFNVTYNNN